MKKINALFAITIFMLLMISCSFDNTDKQGAGTFSKQNRLVVDYIDSGKYE